MFVERKKQKFSLLLTVASLTHTFIILKFNYFNLLIVGVMKSCDLTAFFSMIFHFLKKKKFRNPAPPQEDKTEFEKTTD